MYVRAKKALGQHFLKDEGIASKIVESLITKENENSDKDYHNDNQNNELKNTITDVLEIGPGTGVLTKYLLERSDIKLKVVELDSESVKYLRQNYPILSPYILQTNFLKMKLEKFFPGNFMIIGNFPYNISSQIFFKILDYKDNVPQIVCMLQKEVAERIASAPKSKAYGILSVLLQAWYNIEYLFTVDSSVFLPPPKVQSAVIRLKRNTRTSLNCDADLFKAVIKTCFNLRRKTIRNSIKPLILKNQANDIPNISILDESCFEFTFEKKVGHPETRNLLDMRPEQLSVEDFILFTQKLSTK